MVSVLFAALMVFGYVWRKGYKEAEGSFVLFCTLGGLEYFYGFFGISLFSVTLCISLSGPYSARAQQKAIGGRRYFSDERRLAFFFLKFISTRWHIIPGLLLCFLVSSDP